MTREVTVEEFCARLDAAGCHDVEAALGLAWAWPATATGA
jgi:hypothetical protein